MTITLPNPAKQIAIAARTWPAYGPFPEPPYPLAPLYAPLEVMDNPPIVTVGAANAASVISGGTAVLVSDSSITKVGTRNGLGSVFPNDSFWSPTNIAASDGSKTLYVAGNWGIEFLYDGSQLEVYMIGKGSASGYRCTVVGEGAESATGHAGLTADGNLYRVLYDFGSAAERHIRFDFGPAAHIRSITRQSGTTISTSAESRPTGPTVVIVGDSFTEGTGATRFGLTGYWDRLWQQVGWYDLAASGWGGTGYVNTNGGTATTIGTRLQKDAIDAAPDVLLYAFGINDHLQSQVTLATNTAATFIEAETDLPDATRIVLGPWWKSGSPPATIMQTRDTIRTAALAHGATFIDPIGGPVPYSGTLGDYLNTGWITGTGYVGSEADDGNADLYISSDGTHPTQAGHDYLGGKLAQAILVAHPELIKPVTGWPFVPPPPPPATYAEAILATTGLTGYWRLNEPSGSSAADSSGAGNTATLTNISTFAQTSLLTGDGDTSMSFNGTNGFARDSDIASWNTTTYTMECWWHNTRALGSAGSHGKPLARGTTSSAADSILIRGTGGSTPGILAFNNGSSSELPGVITAANTTYYMAFVRNGSTIKVYLNGALVYTGTHASNFGSNTMLTIGADGSNGGVFQGRIDEVAVYNGELDAATILEHYEYGTGVLP